jgi:hypothetical protein
MNNIDSLSEEEKTAFLAEVRAQKIGSRLAELEKDYGERVA